MDPGFLAVFLYRLAVAAHRAHLLPVARTLYLANLVLFGADLSPRVTAGPGLVILNPVGIGLGAGSRLGVGVVLGKGITLGTAGMADPTRDGLPTLGDRCMVLDDAKVLGPVQLGDWAVIGANALVMRSVPAGAIVAASQARIVRFQEGYAPPGAADVAGPPLASSTGP